MERAEYLQALRDLLSKEPDKVREANRELFHAVTGGEGVREADLVLAEVGVN